MMEEQHKAFIKSLTETGRYDSNPDELGHSFFPTLAYYAFFIRQLRREGNRAKNNPDYTAANMQLVSFEFLKKCEQVGCPIHIEGHEYVRQLKEDKQGKAPIVIANHMSSLETTTLFGMLNCWAFSRCPRGKKKARLLMSNFCSASKCTHPMIFFKLN